MKKVLFALTALVLMVSSCKKEETNDPGNGNPVSVVGKWIGDEVYVKYAMRGTGFDEVIPGFEITSDIGYINIDFKNDGQMVVDSLGTVVETSSYSVDGNMMYWYDQQDTSEFEIERLTASNLDLSLEEVLDEMGDTTIYMYQAIKLIK